MRAIIQQNDPCAGASGAPRSRETSGTRAHDEDVALALGGFARTIPFRQNDRGDALGAGFDAHARPYLD
jgi:hypothetical protein